MVKITTEDIKVDFEGAEIKIPEITIQSENERKASRFYDYFINFLAERRGDEKPFTINEDPKEE